MAAAFFFTAPFGHSGREKEDHPQLYHLRGLEGWNGADASDPAPDPVGPVGMDAGHQHQKEQQEGYPQYQQ